MYLLCFFLENKADFVAPFTLAASFDAQCFGDAQLVPKVSFYTYFVHTLCENLLSVPSVAYRKKREEGNSQVFLFE